LTAIWGDGDAQSGPVGRGKHLLLWPIGPAFDVSPLLPSAFTCLLIAIGSLTMGDSSDAVKARAEAMFRTVAAGETVSAGRSEYLAKQQAELDKTSRLRALRLAREQPKK
jgi:hypothetical protein